MVFWKEVSSVYSDGISRIPSQNPPVLSGAKSRGKNFHLRRDDIWEVIIYSMTCEKLVMMFLPPETTILVILKCIRSDFTVKNTGFAN